jgi:hypothetical protein
MVKAYKEFTLSKGDYLQECEWIAAKQLKAVRAKTQVS